jgi:hypothetical protein
VYLVPACDVVERELEVALELFALGVRERDPPLEREREFEPEAMVQNYARALTFPGITGECSDIRMPRNQRLQGIQTEGGNPYFVIHAVALPGSLPSTNGALVSRTVPAGRATGFFPKFVTLCHPFGRTK